MKDDDMTRLEALCEAATPGPWVSQLYSRHDAWVCSEQHGNLQAVLHVGANASNTSNDAALTAEYRAIAPLLARKLERMSRTLNHVLGYLEDVREGHQLAEEALLEIEAME